MLTKTMKRVKIKTLQLPLSDIATGNGTSATTSNSWLDVNMMPLLRYEANKSLFAEVVWVVLAFLSKNYLMPLSCYKGHYILSGASDDETTGSFIGRTRNPARSAG